MVVARRGLRRYAEGLRPVAVARRSLRRYAEGLRPAIEPRRGLRRWAMLDAKGLYVTESGVERLRPAVDQFPKAFGRNIDTGARP